MLVNLEEFSMLEIIGIAEKSKGDLVTIRMKDPHLFMVYGDGHVIYASYRKLLGEEAFLSALLLDKGVVEITHLPLDIRIRPNITYVYDELLEEGSRRVEDFKSLIAQIGSLKVVPNVCRELRVEQLNINGLHWGIIVGAFKCLTIYDVAGVLRVSEYDIAKAALDLVKAGAITMIEKSNEVVIQRPLPEETPAASKHLNEPFTESKKPAHHVEATIGTNRLVGQPYARLREINARQQNPQPENVNSAKDIPAKTMESSVKPPLNLSLSESSSIEVTVTVLPFGASLGTNDTIDDSCLVLNTDLFQKILKTFGENATRAYVVNPEKSEVEPLLVRLVPAKQVVSAALTVGAFLKLGARNGQLVKILPLPTTSPMDKEG